MVHLRRHLHIHRFFGTLLGPSDDEGSVSSLMLHFYSKRIVFNGKSSSQVLYLDVGVTVVLTDEL